MSDNEHVDVSGESTGWKEKRVSKKRRKAHDRFVKEALVPALRLIQGYLYDLPAHKATEIQDVIGIHLAHSPEGDGWVGSIYIKMGDGEFGRLNGRFGDC